MFLLRMDVELWNEEEWNLLPILDYIFLANDLNCKNLTYFFVPRHFIYFAFLNKDECVQTYLDMFEQIHLHSKMKLDVNVIILIEALEQGDLVNVLQRKLHGVFAKLPDIEKFLLTKLKYPTNVGINL